MRRENDIPHPYVALRKQHGPFKASDLLPHAGTIQRFNAFLAVKITDRVGTMWCAYLFGILALIKRLRVFMTAMSISTTIVRHGQ